MIKVQGTEDCKKFNTVLQGMTSTLGDLRVSTTEGLGGISLEDGVNPKDLIASAIESQKDLSLKKLKVSLTSKGYFQIGSSTATKHILIGEAIDSTTKEKCLCIISKVKETSPKFIGLLNERNLGLEDIHALSIRECFNKLKDCKLKTIVLSYIKQAFTIPTQDSLKVKKDSVPTKIKYLQSSLNSTFKYLNDESLKTSTNEVVNEFLVKLEQDPNFTKVISEPVGGSSEPVGGRRGTNK